MSPTPHVEGFKPPDATWKKMKKVWDSCAEAGIDPPDEVEKYFEGEPPDDSGVLVELEKHPAVKEYNEEMRDGFEVNLSKLPKDITILRFTISY